MILTGTNLLDNSNLESYKKHQEERWIERFCKPLSKIFNEHVIPIYGEKLTFNIQLTLHNSGQYGVYLIPIYKEGEEVCHIIADIILGEFKFYNGKVIEK